MLKILQDRLQQYVNHEFPDVQAGFRKDRGSRNKIANIIKAAGEFQKNIYYCFPDLEPVCYSMSSSNCCLLTCIQISQEAGKVVWWSHLLKNFPQFVVIHTVKGFNVVNEAEVDFFGGFPCFYYDPADIDKFDLVPLPFLNPACTFGSSWFTYY